MKGLLILYSFTILVLSLVTCYGGSPVMLEALEGKYYRRLYDYKLYAAVTLERIDLPPHTVSANISLKVTSNDGSCSDKKVHVYANQYGIPVVSRDKEVFPEHTHTPKMVANVTLSSDDDKHDWILTRLLEGSLYMMAVMPHDDTRIRQKGLYTECRYYLTLQATIQYYAEGSIPLITNAETSTFMLEGGASKLIGFKIPADTSSYEIEIKGCDSEPCQLDVFLLDALSPDIWKGNKTVCTFKTKGLCTVKKTSPRMGHFHYIGLSLTSSKNETFRLSMVLHSCTRHNETTAQASNSVMAEENQNCVLSLGRETPASAADDSIFHDRFTVWDEKTGKPRRMISVDVPDDIGYVMRFTLRGSDTGATLNLDLFRPGVSSPDSKLKQTIEVTLCAVTSRMVLSGESCDGASLRINSGSKEKKVSVMVPYPQTSDWYLSLQSRCFDEGNNGSSNGTVKCDETPQANLTVRLSSCVNGGCGKYGSCKLYTGAGIIYKACECFSGWRGYGCNDGSKAEGLTGQRVAVYLLTFSNLGFIPGICLALRRRFYVEAFVYAFNMFFSTFYHACDSSHIYKLCILSFEALSFADFFSSLMSFAVTLLAMARIPINLRSFLHIVAAMFIAVGEVYNRHGLFEQLTPIATGLAIVVVTWGIVMYKRKSLFPSKRRYLKFIIPGVTLAVLGLVLNLAVETNENYKYVHSVWHLLVSAAIVFLLPPRRGVEEQGPLSVQSGDVTSSHQGLFLDEERLANIQNANEPDQSSDSSLLNPSLVSGMMLTNRNRQSDRNFVL